MGGGVRGPPPTPSCEEPEEIPGVELGKLKIDAVRIEEGGEGRGGGGELMTPDLLYILPHLKVSLYRFRIEQFGDIHCKITIRHWGASMKFL